MQWKALDTGKGWTLQNAYDRKYLGVHGDLNNGTAVVGDSQARTWDLRPEGDAGSDTYVGEESKDSDDHTTFLK